MHRSIAKTIRDIKSLRIQGARNVAKASLKALIILTQESKAKTPAAFLKEFGSTAGKLAGSRPTEPMMRNLLKGAVLFVETEKGAAKDMAKLKKTVLRHIKETLRRVDTDKGRLAKYGAALIPDNGLILTHCHSSTATGILVEARRLGKRFKVVAFETRPRYQGRKTAKELAGAGIDVTLAVDGAMALFMKKADMVIVGADSITSRGDLINKIGTSTLAHIAKMYDVSVFVAAELGKYSPMTVYGKRERIEERDAKEVWERPPRKVKVRNPAFEVTAAKYINGYVTEIGVIPPQSFFTMAMEKLGIKL